MPKSISLEPTPCLDLGPRKLRADRELFAFVPIRKVYTVLFFLLYLTSPKNLNVNFCCNLVVPAIICFFSTGVCFHSLRKSLRHGSYKKVVCWLCLISLKKNLQTVASYLSVMSGHSISCVVMCAASCATMHRWWHKTFLNFF